MLPSEADWPAWMIRARNETKVRELPGPGINPRIKEYYQVTKGNMPTDDAVPWCAAFACWCLEQAGVDSPRSKAARSFLKWGTALDAPRFGAIAVFSRGDPKGTSGHVGFVAGTIDGQSIWLLGGNQQNRVTYERRTTVRLLGIRWP